MTDLVDRSLSFLLDSGVEVAEGLSEKELEAIQRRFRFEFGPDHRELLSKGVPIGEGWYNWRSESVERLTEMLNWPLEGVLFDVTNNAFWPPSWGERPSDLTAALKIAELRSATWPTLVPLFSHRFMAAAPSTPGAPVFSVYQTDVIFYGSNILEYVRHEFGSKQAPHFDPVVDWSSVLPPWSLFATGVEVP